MRIWIDIQDDDNGKLETSSPDIEGIGYGELAEVTVDFGELGSVRLPFRCVGRCEEGRVMLSELVIITGIPFDEGESNKWEGSTIKSWLNNVFLEAIEEDVRGIIAVHGPSDSRVFLPSAGELGFRDGGCDDEPWEWFDANSAAARSALSGEKWWYWTRTAYASNSFTVRRVLTDGSLNYGNAWLGSYGLRPAFVISDQKSGYLR